MAAGRRAFVKGEPRVDCLVDNTLHTIVTANVYRIFIGNSPSVYRKRSACGGVMGYTGPEALAAIIRLPDSRVAAALSGSKYRLIIPAVLWRKTNTAQTVHGGISAGKDPFPGKSAIRRPP